MTRRNWWIFTSVMFLVTLVSFVAMVSSTSTIQSVGPFQINTDAELIQTCSNLTSMCDFCNISSIKNQNSTSIVSDVVMTRRSADFNYTITGDQISQLGTYIVTGYCGAGGEILTWAYSFDVTPSGSEKPNSGEGLSLIGLLAIMALVAGFFLVIAFMANNDLVKSMFIGLSAFIMGVVIFFGMTTVTNILASYQGIYHGYYTFFYFMLLVIVIAVFAVTIFAFVRSLHQMKIRRGDMDPDNFQP